MGRHPVAVVILHMWQLGKKKITGTIPAFALGPRKTKKTLYRDGRSQDLPVTDF
jgi:hypothetical protein